jgi:hypothetical protein
MKLRGFYLDVGNKKTLIGVSLNRLPFLNTLTILAVITINLQYGYALLFRY